MPWRIARGRLILAWMLVSSLLLALRSHADPALAADTNPLARELPGREALESLRRGLAVPSAAERWRGLPEFGRELFVPDSLALARFAPVENAPVGPDYVLGPGDNLVVFVSSFVDSSFMLTLDREGKVFLPRVGSTFLWGLPFADADRLIRSRIATVLRNARVQVSMGRIRALEVFVLGAVTHPGKYPLSGMATAFNALAVAGGPSMLGSLRDVRVLRANREVAQLDLYPFLTEGDRSNDARLQNGDVVFVGLAKGRVGIDGAVIRPGVYESNGKMTLRALLKLAGGPSPFADLERIRVERVDANGGFRLQDLPLDHGHGIDPDSLTLSDYDLVTVFPLNTRLKNLVTLDGFVRHPGEYELASGMKLSDLVKPDRLLPEAVLEQAELRRVDAHSFEVKVQPFSVRRLWAGEGDVSLQPLDAVTIFSQARFPRTATIEGEVERPGVYAVSAGERLSHMLERAGGVTSAGSVPASVFTRRSVARQQRSFNQEFVQRQRLALAQQRAVMAQSGDSLEANSVIRAQSDLLAALEQQTDSSRVVLEIDDAGRWIGTVKDPVMEDGDRLLVPVRPATVSVLGSVMNPGAVMARKDASFSTYLKLAGGATRQADLGRSYVLKANGAALPRHGAGNIDAGDAIVVPPHELTAGGFGHALGGSSRLAFELASTAAVLIAALRR